ncbi:hypothetical protein L218DRAFT_524311 [Marasmius fiardii PR-910]|nr:hypothetical protein L218DRAFT_524311 [Marasmius fiardii PR-910]
MADSTTVEKRTRSHLTLPDSTLQLDRSPLKEARSALRNRIELTTHAEDGDSDDDPILLSPNKTTSNLQKRALESPQTSYPKFNSRYKRFKSSEPEAFALFNPTNIKPSHSRHLSEGTAVKKTGSAKRSAPPSIVKKPSSSSSQKTPALANRKPRAKSVPVFLSLSSIPSIDFRNPPASPTRARSRSPDKREPKLDITFLNIKSALDPIVDETELSMDVDTPTPSPQRHQKPGSVQRSLLPSVSDATPKPPHHSTLSLVAPTPTAVADHALGPQNEPSTPSQTSFLEPLSPLTPLVETPAPTEKHAPSDQYLVEDSRGSALKVQAHLLNTSTPDTPTPTDCAIGACLDTDTHTIGTNSSRIQRPSRVPLPKKPKANSTVDGGIFTVPPPMTASTSQSADVGNKRNDPSRNAFKVLMGNRQRMTEKDKELQNKNKKTSSKSAGKARDVEDSRSKETKEAKKTVTIKSKMKARTKPQEPRAIPTFADDEEEEDQEMDKPDVQPDPYQIPDEYTKPDAASSTFVHEPGGTVIPSSPPTSLFSDDQVGADSKIESPMAERESPVNYRASSLFSLNDEKSIEVPVNPEDSHNGFDSGTELFSPLSEVAISDDIISDTTANNLAEPVAEVMAVTAESKASALPPDPVVAEQSTFSGSKGKGKRGPRKKAVLGSTHRPTRVTRSTSSRQQEIEASALPSLDSGTRATPSSSVAHNTVPAATPPSIRSRRKKVDPTDPPLSSEVFKPASHRVGDPITILETVNRPDSALSSELSSLSDSEDETTEESEVLQFSTSSNSVMSQLPVKSKLAPSPSLPQASVARAALPKTPTKSRSASPSKLPRSSSMFASRVNDNQDLRPELAVAGSSYVDLESLLHKLREAPPSRPNTSMGFNRDKLVDDSDVQMQSKDDASVDRSKIGIGRPSSSRPSSKSSLPVFKRPAPVSKDSRGVFIQSGKGALANRKQGAIMRGVPSIYERVAGGVRGQKASQKTALPTVIGSPVKGGGLTTTEGDVIMEDAEAGPSDAQDDLTLADITMPGADMEAESSSSKGKRKEREEKSRRASMALHALSQSLNDISTAREAEAMQPPTPRRRAGLRSSSSTYPSSSVGKNPTDNKKEPEPPRLSVLSDCKVFVDYRSEDPLITETWVQMLKDLGARIMTRLGPTCTHILWKDGLPSTINRYRLLNDPKPFVVGNNWVVSCAQESKHVDETEFLVELKDYTFAAAGHKRRKSMIPKFVANYDDTERTAAQDADVSMDSNTSLSSDLTPLERARMRQSMRT